MPELWSDDPQPDYDLIRVLAYGWLIGVALVATIISGYGIYLMLLANWKFTVGVLVGLALVIITTLAAIKVC